MNLNAVIDFVLHQEDRTMSGIITTTPGDRGGRTRFGIAERWHQDLTPLGFFDSMSRDQALVIARKTYASEYAAPMRLENIRDAALEVAMLSFAINDGEIEASGLLQQALCALGFPVACDHLIGPRTVAAANACEPGKLLDAYCELAKAFYRHIASTQPAQLQFLAGWIHRADEVAASAQTLREEVLA